MNAVMTSCSLGEEMPAQQLVVLVLKACDYQGTGLSCWAAGGFGALLAYIHTPFPTSHFQAGLAQLGERQTEVKLREFYLKVMCSIHINRIFFSFA
jgi:hypothetical protein